MADKHILIVDDEDAILTVLKSSLKKLGPNHIVQTAGDGFTALDTLKGNSFDVIITDYNMARMDGLELIESIRYLQPAARVIMMTAFGNDTLEQETQRLQVYRYLNKPLEINTFRQIVQSALQEKMPKSYSKATSLAGDIQEIDRLLVNLRKDVSARCIFLADVQGRIISDSGDTNQLPKEELATVLGDSITTLNEAGKAIDGDAGAINLAYRESAHQYLYVLNIGQKLLLVIIINRSQYSSRLGTVWYYAQQAAAFLTEVPVKIDPTPDLVL